MLLSTASLENALSPPIRGRGLKYHCLLMQQQAHLVVAPYTGAWIEIGRVRKVL